MKTVNVDVPISIIAELISGVSVSSQLKVGDSGGNYRYVALRAVCDNENYMDSRIEFNFILNGFTEKRISLSISDILHCEEFKLSAALKCINK